MLARERNGFTIIELMLTVGIVGLLATLAIPTMMRFQLRAKASEVRVNLAAIREGQETYFAENGAYASAVPVLPLSIGPVTEPWVLSETDVHGFNDIGWSPEGKEVLPEVVDSAGGALTRPGGSGSPSVESHGGRTLPDAQRDRASHQQGQRLHLRPR